MSHYPDERQLDLIDYLNATATATANDRYTIATFAEKYGVSDGQARTMIAIYGRSRTRLDKVMAAQPYP